MISKNTEYLSRLDHLRFIAATLVATYHFYGAMLPADSFNPLFRLIKEGNSGVSLFMVLSGFILTKICLGKEVDYKAFIRNRLLRIYPLYILFVFMAAFSAGRQIGFISFLALATFMGNLGGTILSKFPHIWTIMVEFQFYLVFPFIVTFFSKNGFSYLIGVISMMLLLRSVIYLSDGSVQDATYWTILGRFDQFVIGMGVAAINQRYQAVFSSPLWLILSFELVIGWEYLFNELCGGYYGPGTPNSTSIAWIFSPTLEAVTYGTVVLSYLHLRWQVPSLLDKTIAYLGSISFSIYMWHLPIIELLRQHYSEYFPVTVFDSFWYLKLIFMVFPIVIAISSLSYFIIEKPFFSLRVVYVKNTSSPEN